MNKPTEEQIKEFWTGVFAGKVEFGTVVNEEVVCYRRTSWNQLDEEWNIEVIPRIDSLEFLGYLFKYVIPKMRDLSEQNTLQDVEFHWQGKNVSDEVECNLIFDEAEYSGTNDDPALALFWAIKESL